MAKVKNNSFLCGVCKQGFNSKKACKDHINAKHQGKKVRIFGIIDHVDLRDDEPSFADRAVEAEIALAMGEHTDDAWLLGL